MAEPKNFTRSQLSSRQHSSSWMDSEKEEAPVNWVATILFLVTGSIALIVVPAYGFMYGFDLFEWLTFAAFLFFSGTGITAGYHRLWAHNAYEAHPIVKYWLAFWGAASVQNSILVWASGHRTHHRYVDSKEKDPYSINRGFWFAHLGWMVRHYKSSQEDFSNAKDLQRDKVVMLQHNHYLKFVFASTIVLPMILGYLNGDVWGTLLLAGFFRLFLNHHFTFFINSLCHMWGKQPYTDTNTAKDNPVLALFTYGEGYHNFHHFFQTDYRNGVRWWQIDPTKWLINFWSRIGLAKNLRRTPAFKIREAMVKMQFQRAETSLQKVSNTADNSWKTVMENEYRQFLATMDEWTQLRGEWMKKQRENLTQKRESLMAKFDTSTVKSRFKELEYALRLQQDRLKQFNRMLATA